MNYKKFFLITCFFIVVSVFIACANSDTYNSVYEGKLVYSIKSNKIHRTKCGEIKHIKKENYRETDDSINSMMQKGYTPCRVCLYYYYKQIVGIHSGNIMKSVEEILNESGISKYDIERYKNVLKSEFKFWPKQEEGNRILDAMVYLYLGIYVDSESIFDTNKDYIRTLASIVYTRDGSYYNNIDWKIVGDLFSNTNETKKYICEKLLNVSEISSIDVSEAYYLNICESVIQQHDSALNNDFAHMCAVISANFSENEKKNIAENLAAKYNGIYDINAQAGYIGDICGVNGVLPKITKGDYAADLDAVNIYDLIICDINKNIFLVMSDYYDDILSGQLNRANRFVENIGEDVIRNHHLNYLEYVSKNYGLYSDEGANRVNYFENFLEHLENQMNTYEPQKYRMYYEYKE